MDGKRLIEKIRLQNILSFGDKGEEITLEPLNIIIGQNASGKSNLVDVIKLLRSLPQDKGLVKFISQNGGINEWIWKGKKERTIEIEVTIKDKADPYLYQIKFTETDQRLDILDESIKHLKTKQILGAIVSFDDSILSNSLTEFIEKDIYFAYIKARTNFSNLLLYTDLQTQRNSEIRRPQVKNVPNDFLAEDANNLALVLNDLERKSDIKHKIVENLKKFNPRIKDYLIKDLGEYIQLYLQEENFDTQISAMRLSDGTLRYLCLLAILCHPKPPPLICIEEPETGLHPDILPTIAELMKEASQRTQLIVTTHSDILVSAFSDMPEAVLVCEKDEDGTHFKRLEADKLKVWLEEYTLGETWLRGGIGGTRW